METVSKVRTGQAALMLVLAGTLWGCGGSNETAAPAAATRLATSTAAVSTDGSTADSPATPDSTNGPAGEALVADAAAAADEFNAAHASKDIYGIINLASPPESRARINNLGQALFEYVALNDSIHLGFFNGERSFDINPPTAIGNGLGGLNERGEATGYTIFPNLPFQVFRWTAKSGPVLLPSLSKEGDTFSSDINNRGEIVGASRTGPGNSPFRAVRWTAKNRLIPLPLFPGFGESLASDINENNVTVGSANDASGNPHVFVWDAATHPTDLGTFGAENAFAVLNNNRGDIVGHLDFFGPDFQAFFWSPGKGAVRVGRNTLVAALNESGVLVGELRRVDTDRDHAYRFTRKGGLVDLHPAKFFSSGASDVNESGVVVGEGLRTATDIGRALRWSPTGAVVDLNTRLLNPPSGLVLTSAFRINDKGDILSQSNAGLVYLRLGGGGTDAPVLGPIQLTEVRLNELTRLTLSFRDRNIGDTHTATVDWGDGSGPQRATVREHKGKGEVSAEHTYVTADVFKIVVRVTDSSGKSTMLNTTVSISPPQL